MDTRNKVRVLDTTVLVEDPEIMYKLGDATVVIPLAVLKELDGLKSSEKLLVAEAARVVGRMLDNFSSYANLTEGVKLSSGGTLAVYKGYEPLSALASEAMRKRRLR
ncbi:MAG: PIN domain-containing protein [Deltaproteobacteria bacterium]